ncbi:hypothetical protein D6779_04180 [Candidatus Parcubacteria bacterium]|nr:MAG: hypothetical protein D6779_04180 [Candidatus Parcubacteria bacterium]
MLSVVFCPPAVRQFPCHFPAAGAGFKSKLLFLKFLNACKGENRSEKRPVKISGLRKKLAGRYYLISS